MKEHNRFGFTLIELLAVMAILGIILAIAIPGISKIINTASRDSLERSAMQLLTAVNYKMINDISFDPNSVNETNVKAFLKVDDDNFKSLTVKRVNNELYVTIIGKNKWDKLIASGTKSIIRVDDTVTSFTRGANAPVLATGMIPIKWNGTAWVNTTESDTAWYNYDTTNKIWANAKTADGSMWVWIPRYVYKISTGWHTATAGTIDIQFSKGVDDNWNKAVIGSINLGESATASNNTWTNHPAFTFGSSELTGIWVAKFAASGTTSAIKFVPNVAFLRTATIGNIFTATRNMETKTIYGWDATGEKIDTHLMKNTEWGAVAYLSKSTYGKNAEIWINNSSTYIAGCAGSTVSAATFTGCENSYDTANGLQASTTGNIYGVYDMVGGAWEYTSAYVDNENSLLITNGSSIISADSKYKDVYDKEASDDVNNYTLAANKKGDAVYEVSSAGSGNKSWYADYSCIPMAATPWFRRGGSHTNTTGSGAFSYHYLAGATGNSFRAVLAISEGL